MASILTRGEIVTAGTQLGGNPGITLRANEFLNLFIDHMSRSFDWRFWLTEASISSGSPIYSFALPVTYGRTQNFQFTNASQLASQVPFVQLWSKLKTDLDSGATSGSVPTHFAIDQGGARGLVWPVPSATWTGKLLYYRIPAEMTSDADIPEFPDAWSLVQAVALYTESYEKESLQVILQRTAEGAIQRYASSALDEGRSNSLNIGLDPAIYGGWKFRES